MIKLSPKRTTAPKKTEKVAKLAAPKIAPPKLASLTASDFTPGQKWQLQLGHAEIVHVGKILIDFRYYRVPNQKRVGIETKTMREFIEALKKNKATLMA